MDEVVLLWKLLQQYGWKVVVMKGGGGGGGNGCCVSDPNSNTQL